VPVRTDPPFTDVAERLAGPALVRLSTAMWRGGREWPDILGAAVRFRRDPHLTEQAAPADQDILFATLRHMWTIPPALLTTDVHDWLENDYYAIAPFTVAGLGRAKLRLTTMRDGAGRQGSRVERLRGAMEDGDAFLTFTPSWKGRELGLALGGGVHLPLGGAQRVRPTLTLSFVVY